uniref:separase n=1 Tax=Syphacia muris TaxID=451379 RepID=A0A0N5AFC3_9BILA
LFLNYSYFLQNIIRDAENEWFGVFSPLLLPHSSLTDEGHDIIKQIISDCTLSIESAKIPKCVDGQKTFYVLDPGGDLTDTQNRLSKMLEQYIFWKGIVGQPPKPEELRQYLQNNDFFLYMGHGSGGRYFGKSTIRSSDCRAVSVLMGCSSARTLYEGDGFDGQSVIYDYSVARCPCLVGFVAKNALISTRE